MIRSILLVGPKWFVIAGEQSSSIPLAWLSQWSFFGASVPLCHGHILGLIFWVDYLGMCSVFIEGGQSLQWQWLLQLTLMIIIINSFNDKIICIKSSGEGKTIFDVCPIQNSSVGSVPYLYDHIKIVSVEAPLPYSPQISQISWYLSFLWAKSLVTEPINITTASQAETCII